MRLGDFNLPLDARLNRILELCLYRLGGPEHLSELRCECLVDRFLHPGLRLVRLRGHSLSNVCVHNGQVRFDILELLGVVFNQAVQLVGLYWKSESVRSYRSHLLSWLADLFS